MIDRCITLLRNSNLKLLLILIALDVIFGVLRSIKERCSNSCIGIDGIIRKAGMIIAICSFLIINNIIGLNFIKWLPDSLLNFINMDTLGIGDLFCILYIIFEFLSILKNMYRCNLPVPPALQKTLEKILKEFTSEINQ